MTVSAHHAIVIMVMGSILFVETTKPKWTFSQAHKKPSISHLCLCLISRKYTWLCTRGKISLNSLKYINHNFKDTNNPVKNEAAKVALNSTLSENSNCYSYIKAWAMGLIWASSVPESLCYALAQHTHSCPCLQLYNLFYVLPGMLGFSLRLWLLAIIGVIWIKCLSLREEQHRWVATGMSLPHIYKHVQSSTKSQLGDLKSCLVLSNCINM